MTNEPVKLTHHEATTKKTLAKLMEEPCCVEVDSTLMHQAFQLPGAGTESSLSKNRPGYQGLKLVYHPGYGLIGFLKGKYFLSPSANMIVGFGQ